MATKFSGGTYVNTTFVGGTKTNICNNMETQLVNAGWTVISGTGTTNVLLQSAADPTTGNQGRVRFKDNGGSCVQVTIENVSGTKVLTSSTTSGAHLLPATSKTFRVLASKYRFEVFTPGVSAAREFVCAGILWIPTPYQGVITEAIYLQGNGLSDSDTAIRFSFRTSLSPAVGVSGNLGAVSCGICNNNMQVNGNSGQSYMSDVQLRVPTCASLGSYTQGTAPGHANLYRWHDGALDMADALMGWGNSAVSDEAFIRGQVYDWTIVGDNLPVDVTGTWSDGGSSHDWWALTGGNTGNSSLVRGTILVATS